MNAVAGCDFCEGALSQHNCATRRSDLLRRHRGAPTYPIPTNPRRFHTCFGALANNCSLEAFTYIKPKKECWLKGAVGSPTFGKGLVTGVKRYETFAPAKVITLN